MSKRRYLLELDEAISAMERGELFWEDMPGLRERFRSVLESGTGDTRGAGSTDAAAPSSPASPVTARHDKATEGRERAESIARQFHETYERLAPTFGYSTRERSRVPWPDVPEDNRRLMVAVVEEVVIPALASEGRTEAAAVDQAIADVEHWVREQTNPLSTPRSRTEAKDRGRAALRVLADAAEEARKRAVRAQDAALQYQDERDRLAAEVEALGRGRTGWPEVDAHKLENVRLARQVADLKRALRGIAEEPPPQAWADASEIARAALAAARSRDPQEPSRTLEQAVENAYRARDPQEPQT